MKVDPSDGRIIWKKAIGGSYLGNLVAIETVDGTTDVVVSSPSANYLTFVSSSGASGVSIPSNASWRNIATCYPVIALWSSSGNIKAYNYSGRFLWEPSLTVLGVGGQGLGQFIQYAGGSFISRVEGPASYNFAGVDPTNGSLDWTTYVGPLIGGPSGMGFLEANDGTYFLDRARNIGTGGWNCALRNVSDGRISVASSLQLNRARWCGSNYCCICNLSGANNQAGITSGSSLTLSMSVTSIAGATLDSLRASAGIDSLNVYVFGGTNNLGTGYYSGTGGTKFNFFAMNSGGELLWTQNYGTPKSVGPGPELNDMCIGNDGYLYVCGSVTE